MPSETEKDAGWLKKPVFELRDFSQKKQHLQGRIDLAKKTYQGLLEEMKAIQS